jgi:Endonuclease NucS
MFKVDIAAKQLHKLTPKTFAELGLLERFDIQEWVVSRPDVLDEELLVLAKEYILPSGIRLDLLALDKAANLVVVELKRDSSGSDVEWQAIKYASYCSNFAPTDIFEIYALYLGTNGDDAQLKIEVFIETQELDSLNQKQRIILVAQEFHSDVASAVLWLRDYNVDVKCIRLRAYTDSDGDLFLNPDVIIPLPEAKDYIERREAKKKETSRPLRSSFSLEKGNFSAEDLSERLTATLARQSDLTPRLVAFLGLLLSEDRVFGREEIKQGLFAKGIGSDVGQTGRFLSNLSQFLTKESNPHLRQIVEFQTGGEHGETKDNYRIQPQYRQLVANVIHEGQALQVGNVVPDHT